MLVPLNGFRRLDIKRMQNVTKCLIPTIAGVLMLSATFMANAVPVLQLGIIGGTYDPITETIFNSADPFNLVAYWNGVPTGSNDNTPPGPPNYYISVAVVPQIGPSAPSGGIGSFKINGTPYDISDMVYGNPPLDVLGVNHDAGDLPPHGIFDTYFTEVKFQFSGAKTKSVNTQDNPGYDPTDPVNTGNDLFYQIFNVDTSGLLAGYDLHFDLYDETLIVSSCFQKVKGKLVPIPGCTPATIDNDVNKFAPFSHDAQTHDVPEPAPLVLLAIGVLGLVITSRRSRCKA